MENTETETIIQRRTSSSPVEPNGRGYGYETSVTECEVFLRRHPTQTDEREEGKKKNNRKPKGEPPMSDVMASSLPSPH